MIYRNDSIEWARSLRSKRKYKKPLNLKHLSFSTHKIYFIRFFVWTQSRFVVSNECFFIDKSFNREKNLNSFLLNRGKLFKRTREKTSINKMVFNIKICNNPFFPSVTLCKLTFIYDFLWFINGKKLNRIMQRRVTKLLRHNYFNDRT